MILGFLCWTLLASVSVAFADQRNITAKPGENVTLPCEAAQDRHVLVAQWKRTDLRSEYILLYRDEQIDPDCQSASFKDRVGLKDVHHGDPSLILSNVTTNDAGTYQCQVVYENGNEKQGTRSEEPICTINLTVELGNKDRGQDEAKAGGNKTRLIVGVILVVILVIIAAVVFCWCRRRQRSLRPDANPHVEEVEQDCEDVNMEANL